MHPDAVQPGLLVDVETRHLDRGYDGAGIRATCHQFGPDDVICARRLRDNKKRCKRWLVHAPIGPPWPIVRTNSWLANIGQLRRNTDPWASHLHTDGTSRHAATDHQAHRLAEPVEQPTGHYALALIVPSLPLAANNARAPLVRAKCHWNRLTGLMPLSSVSVEPASPPRALRSPITLCLIS